MKQFDYLMPGGGIAGLRFALKVVARGRVAIVTEKNRAESNSFTPDRAQRDSVGHKGA